MRSIIFGLILLFTSSVLAEDSYVRYALPLGKRLQVDGEIYRGFNLPEYKDLLKMDIRLKAADTLIIDLYKKTELLDGKVLQLNNIITLDNESINLLKKDLNRKDLLITKLTKENVMVLDKLNRRKRIMRIVLPIIGVAAGAFAVGLAVK